MFASIAIAAVLNLIAAFLPHWGALVVIRTLSGIALGGVPAVAMVYLGKNCRPTRWVRPPACTWPGMPSAA